MVSLPDAVGRAASAASDNATALGYLSGWRLVRLLSESASRAVFARIAGEVYRRNGTSVRRLRANLPGSAPSSTTRTSTR